MRKEGYYFVKYDSNEWEIAYFNGEEFLFIGSDWGASEEYLNKIGDKIELPKD